VNLQAQQPIGIFDSGIGGLTVAHAISQLLPHENLVYYGDTAHLPYGDKSAEAVRQFSLGITKFLEEQNCKMVVVACNTASAAAFEALQSEFGERILLVNVIDPMVDFVQQHYPIAKVGIIATKGTVHAKVYPRKLAAKDVTDVNALATPLLVHLIEEGFSKHAGSKLLVEEYLNQPELKDIDVLILACTHYPIIKGYIEDFYQKKVEVLDSTLITAEAVKSLLAKHSLLNKQSILGTHQFFVSDYTSAFEQITKLFWGEAVLLQKNNIWEKENI
jgi:glutamate racemase